MLMAIDVGNTNMVFGLLDGERLVGSFRLMTDANRTSDEIGLTVCEYFRRFDLTMDQVTDIIIASVVPQVMYTLTSAIIKYFGKKPIIIDEDVSTGIRYQGDDRLGADRSVSCVAAMEKYGKPLVVLDFGTATTFGVVSERGEFLGGAICPGIKLASEALTERTSRLPKIELVKPESVIGRNTVSNMQSGLVYGFIGQVTYLIDCMKRELGAPDAKVIATGGMSRLIASGTDAIDEIDGLLTLKGLRIIYERNQPRA